MCLAIIRYDFQRDSPILVSACEFILHFCESVEMEKILVKWTDERSKGTTSLVKKSAVKKGEIAVGKKVVVAWGKTKKMCNAKVIHVGGVRSLRTPRHGASNEEPFTFELAFPAPEMQVADLPEPSHPALQAMQEDGRIGLLMDKLDDLADAVSGIEARLMHRLQMLEETVQKAVTERPQTNKEDHPLPPLEPCILPVPPSLPVEMPTPGPMPFWHGPEISETLTMTPVLQDVSSRANILYSPPVRIASDVVNLAL